MATNSASTLLLAGFQPFGGEPVNPSQRIATALDGRSIGRYQVRSVILPVSFAAAPVALRQALRRHRPEVAVALGQAGGRPRISLERVAVNLIDARIPDEDGAQPIDVPVRSGAPTARFATLPLKAMLAAARAADWPVELSLTAGSFVCNAVLFELLQQLRRSAVRAGFIHVPWLPEQAERHGGPALGLDEQVAVVAGLLACVDAVEPDGVSGGREC